MLTLTSTCDQTVHFDGVAYHFLANKAVSLPANVASQLARKPDIELATAKPKATRKSSVTKKLVAKVKKAVGRTRKS